MALESLRIDRWLWCARWHKTRSLAAEEVKAGHVRVNGQRVKPARDVRVGDVVAIAKGSDDFEIVIRGLPERRGPAAEAQGCYEETPVSIERRALRSAARATLPRAPTSGRPDKRTRRLIRSQVRRPGDGADDVPEDSNDAT